MRKSILRSGDLAVIRDGKPFTGGHSFPLGTVVRLDKRYKDVSGYHTYYCTAVDGELKGLTQIVPVRCLEKKEK